jgi:hypothetical protein
MNTTITPEIASFAEAVRDALHDLPAEERDELTDGLEADLAEAYAEDLQRELPDPVDYATELRNAAGLPKSEPDRGVRPSIADSARRVRADLGAAVRGNPTLSAAADFLVTLRPVWWVARAWVAAWLVAAFFGLESGVLPTSPVMLVVLGVFVLVSVQWGRGRWTFTGLSPLVVVGNALAVVLLVPVVAIAGDQYASATGGDVYADSYPSASAGLMMDGMAVRNVYAYDAKGRPLSDVQLFDEQGRPLEVLLDPISDECEDAECRSGYRVDPDGSAAQVSPGRLTNGRSVLNVFPLSLVPMRWDEQDGRRTPAGDAVTPPPPFDRVPGVDRLEGVEDEQKVAPSNE